MCDPQSGSFLSTERGWNIQRAAMRSQSDFPDAACATSRFAAPGQQAEQKHQKWLMLPALLFIWTLTFAHHWGA